MTAPPSADEVAEIAEKLTAPMRDAVFGRFSFTSPMEQEDGELMLVELGIWKKLYGIYGPERLLTPLGLAVRNHLIGETK